MSERIQKPCSFSDEEKNKIAQHYKTKDDWDNNPPLDSIKQKIKDHLNSQQDNLCCYCHFPMGIGPQKVTIEHILDKKDYEKFGFEPLNLALACPHCNSTKGAKPVLKHEGSKDIYPLSNSEFIVLHAHYHNYSEHIIKDGAVYTAISDIGKGTITACHLDKIKDVEELAKQHYHDNLGSKAEAIKNELHRLMLLDLSDEEKSVLIENIRNL